MSTLRERHCVPCEGGASPLSQADIDRLLPAVPQWSVAAEDRRKIRRTFLFRNYADAMAFAVAITPIAEAEGHHPDLHVSYGKVTVELWTHAIGGLSENDFIVAAKIDGLSG